MIFTLILAFGVQEKSYETFWRFSNLKSESLQSYDLVHMKKNNQEKTIWKSRWKSVWSYNSSPGICWRAWRMFEQENPATRWRIKVIVGNADQQMEAWETSENPTLRKQFIVLSTFFFVLQNVEVANQTHHESGYIKHWAEYQNGKKTIPDMSNSLCKLVQLAVAWHNKRSHWITTVSQSLIRSTSIAFSLSHSNTTNTELHNRKSSTLLGRHLLVFTKFYLLQHSRGQNVIFHVAQSVKCSWGWTECSRWRRKLWKHSYTKSEYLTTWT